MALVAVWRWATSSPSLLPTITTSPIKVLCWVPYKFANDVYDPNDATVARIRSTLEHECDKLVFITLNQGPEHLGFLHHEYSRIDAHDLWNQVSRGWFMVGERYGQDYDYFVKIDADTLFFPNNLKFWSTRKQWDANNNYYFGHTIFEQSREITEPRSQFNLGAGYGISRGLMQLMQPYFANPHPSTNEDKHKKCPEWHRWGEDYKFADCLRTVLPALIPNNTKDEWNRETFLPFDPEYHIAIMNKTFIKWFWRGKVDSETNELLHCCSSRPILFHKLNGDQYVTTDYFTNLVAVDPLPV